MRLKHNLIAGGLATLGASLCCVGPLVLVMLGIGGSWVADLTKLETTRPFFLGLSLYFMYRAWRSLYRQTAPCDTGTACANNTYLRWQKRLFWLSIPPLLLLLTFPWYAALFY